MELHSLLSERIGANLFWLCACWFWASESHFYITISSSFFICFLLEKEVGVYQDFKSSCFGNQGDEVVRQWSSRSVRPDGFEILGNFQVNHEDVDAES